MTSLKALFAFFSESIQAAFFIIKLCGLKANIKRKVDALLAHIIGCVKASVIIGLRIVVNAAKAGSHKAVSAEALGINCAGIKLRFGHFNTAIYAGFINNFGNSI